MNYLNYDIIAIVGPTAVGKTKFSIELAKEINAEIINGDATQVYKKLNIGSAKTMPIEMDGVPHHLIDIKEPNEDYSVADFQRDCRNKIDELIANKKKVIICGGSGLYIQAVLFSYNFDKTFNKETSKYSKYSDGQIVDEYIRLFPLNNDNMDLKNINRLRNYLIRFDLGIKEEVDGQTKYYDNFKIIGITCDRKILHQKINDRVEQMFEAGLIDEVKQFNECDPSQTAIGYKEVHEYLAGKISLEQSKELIKRNTRRFAKRQYTWFNNKMDVVWYDSVEEKWQ